MTETCIVGVPPDDTSDLTTLVSSLEVDGDLAEQRYFDGATFVEVVLPLLLSSSAWKTLRAWIVARADVRKATRIAYRGIEITATNPKDAIRIIQLLEEGAEVRDEA
jgi:hypothetical protein